MPLVSYRVVAEIAVNSDSVTLGNLMPNTQYQVTVTAFKAGRRFRSRPVIFKTLGKLDKNTMFNHFMFEIIIFLRYLIIHYHSRVPRHSSKLREYFWCRNDTFEIKDVTLRKIKAEYKWITIFLTEA